MAETVGHSVARNTFLLGATELLTKVFSLVLIMVVARTLGPEMMGVYAFAVAFLKFFEISIDFGLDPYIQREVGRRPELAGPLMARVFALKLAVYLLSLVAIVALGLFLFDDGFKRTIVWILSFALFFRVNLSSANSFFRARQQARYEAMVVMAMRLTYSLLGIAALLSGRGLVTLVTLELAAHAVACLVGWRLFLTRIARVPDIPWAELKVDVLRLARSAREFLFIRVVLTILNATDMVMLSLLSGNLSTGLYAAALRLTTAFDFLPSAFTGAFFPVLSRHAASDWPSFVGVFRQYFKCVLVMGTGIALLLAGTAGDLLALLFGESFRTAGPTLALLALMLTLDFVNMPLSNAILALDRERAMLRLFGAAASFNVAANAVLIPLLSHTGAALATLLSQALILGLQCREVGLPRLRELGLLRLAAKPVAAALAGLACIALLSGLNVHVLLTMAGGGAFFAAALLALGTFSRSELKALLSIVRPRRPGYEAA
jgi:O-antigen/teichoic acid export membrane protein